MASQCFTVISQCELQKFRDEDVVEFGVKTGTIFVVDIIFKGGLITVPCSRVDKFPEGVDGVAKFASHPISKTVAGQKKSGGYWTRNDQYIQPGLLLEFVPEKR